MTEEDINKKAEKHCNEVLCNAHEKCYEVIKCRDWRSRRAGFFCGYEQALKDLEKENAELKKFKRECETSICRAEYQYNYEQLTKAKHYIKELVRAVEHSYSVLSWQRPPIKAEAEQFLSEVEK